MSESIYFNGFSYEKGDNLRIKGAFCIENNKGINVLKSDLGSCFIFIDLKKIDVFEIFIEKCQSDYTTTGIRMKYSENYLFSGQFEVIYDEIQKELKSF